ncbi:MAG: hypothetical protein KIC46_09405, partial [Clostridiales bacterium]|nr:hypothetical protein [Clostridiales bacterium]
MVRSKVRTPARVLAAAMAVLMVLCTMPFTAFAAVTLSASNVEEWPTVTSDGPVYYGQQMTAFTLEGGKVVYNGEVVSGHFEWQSPTGRIIAGTNFAPVKFVSEDSAYTGFTDRKNVQVTINQTKPIIEEQPIAANKIPSGEKLSACNLTGGKAVNPYNTAEPNLAKATWEWVNPDQVVTESGEYEAQLVLPTAASAKNYDTTEAVCRVAVEVEGQVTIIPETEITTAPTVSLNGVNTFTYTPGRKIGDLELVGGQVTVSGTEEVVSGKFEFDEYYAGLELTAGTKNIPVHFVLDNPDAYKPPADVTVQFEVAKADIVVKEAPTFTYVYSNRTLRDLGTVGAEIQSGVVEPSTVKWDFVGKTGLSSDASDPLAKQVLDAGTYQVTARATVSNGSFNTGFFPVNVVIKADETKTFPMKVALEGNDLHIKADTTYGGYGGKGTVTYSVNDTVVAQNADPKAEVVYAIPESGDYTVKAEYTPAENDNYIYKSATQTVKAVLPRTVTVNGGSGSGNYKPGDTVKVEFDQASLKKYYEFKGWKITNAEGETVDVGVSDLTQTSISFTMPDEDVT